MYAPNNSHDVGKSTSSNANCVNYFINVFALVVDAEINRLNKHTLGPLRGTMYRGVASLLL